MHMTLVHMEFMRMLNAASSGCPPSGPVQSVLGMNRRDTRKEKSYIAVPAYVGSLAGVKVVPLTKPGRAGEQEQNI
eukprot:1156591-Pelagomonas_calceolata.AAC.1